MAKIIIKDGEISSSAGINIPGSLSISGNVTIGDNFTDTLTVKSAATFNDDLTVLDTISASIGNFSTVNVGTISATNFVGLPPSAGGATPPGGADTNIQFNKQGAFSGSSNLTFNYTTNTLSGTTAQFTTLSASNTNINGNITITGSNNGIIFPDGTKTTTVLHFPVDLVIVGGGGGGGGASAAATNAGGGGGGGYFESGQTSYGELFLTTQKRYSVGVGAGGAGGTSGGAGTNGGDSYFAYNYVLGGGGGGGSVSASGKSGGSGGGSANGVSVGTSIFRTYQIGNSGGQGDTGLSGDPGGGGGGAVDAGNNGSAIRGGSGGRGILPRTFEQINYSSGGGGGADSGIGLAGGSSAGNGGAGVIAAANGTANTGGGGGGAGYTTTVNNGGQGGSGVILIKYPSIYSITFSAGISETTTISGSFKITKITAAAYGIDSVIFS